MELTGSEHTDAEEILVAAHDANATTTGIC
jgi:hypothetical protein